MSAWVCSKAHIDAMVTACIELGGHGNDHPAITWPGGEDGAWKRLDVIAHITTDEIGTLLRDTIVTGVSHRYPDDDVSKGELPGPSGGEDVWYLKPYKWEKTRALADGEIVALIYAYEYQASEHHEWMNTFGWKFCEHVKYKLLKRVEAAWEQKTGECVQWGYEDEHVFPGFKPYLVELQGDVHPSQHPLQSIKARSQAEAIERAEKWFGGKVVSIEQTDRKPTKAEADKAQAAQDAWRKADEAKPEPTPTPVPADMPVPPINPDIADMLRRLGAASDDGGTPPIRNKQR